MIKLFAFVKAYTTKDDGATAIEYGLIAAGIALAISAAVFAFGGELNTLFEGMGDSLKGTP